MPDVCFDDDRLAWLTLASFPGFGNKTLRRLRERYGLRASALRISLSDLEAWGHGSGVQERFAEYRRIFNSHSAVERLERNGIRFVLMDDAEYPPLLRQISDPPVALFVRGTFPDPIMPTLAIVGTRSCTSYGRRVTRELAQDLAMSGLTIVSGLALGIDAIAHDAALDAGGGCIAVLGSGPDDASLYPRSNLRLAHRIITTGGAVVSEFSPGTESFKHHFPLRNRIIAGLSRTVLVTEAALGSGSLITAHLATSYNRDVYAVPGSILCPQSSGTNHLISQGAMLATEARDILAEFHSPVSSHIPSQRISELEENERRIMEALDEPCHVNDLARMLRCGIRDLQRRLTVLEIKGFIETQSGQIIARSRHVFSGK